MTDRKGYLPQIATVVAVILAAAANQQVLAADADVDAADSGSGLSEVIVTGTRQKGVDVASSAAPIQVIGGDQLAATGKGTLVDALAQLVPSFQAQAFGGDMANQTLQARLRGLSPNHTLVLVDGKRRHTTASLAVLSGSPYSGGAGVDLNFIPMALVDHIEVLTEGAAAQYGSDAIAGVINIILKKNKSGGNIDATYGGFFDGGGQTTKVEAEAGFAPADNVYFELTGSVYNHGHTTRGGPDPRALDPASYPDTNMSLLANSPYINYIEGDGEVHQKLVGFNTGIKFSELAEVYAFGTYGYKNAASYENYRVPSKVSYTDGTNPDAGTVVTYPFPNGFNPLEQSKEDDFQLTVGVKGGIGDWTWDLATAYGEDHMNIYTINSANASLYADYGATATNFYDGKFIATQA